ncbi:plastocyanin/azurin family copper-binding protein [Azospirillum sp. TSO22-1]|uniref:cupredoxin domain-containing protein n=1 Tax=Azospirillum sp. TSO22-1 TaxID=716789 RepID=UPI000D610CC9|nr:plastocyanin/azurin family copper-binding protein [Azospirillum sp. TSO22-1]PWC34904.1 hypothetical protein TSO221_30825 [Azospirillum sp. TSO22-1]
MDVAGARIGVALSAVLAATPALGGEYVIEQREKAFHPVSIAIRPGDTVAFTNADPFAHNMFSATPGAEFNLGAQNPGEHKAVVLRKPGTVDVECQIHPKMRLTVVVK